MAKITDEEREQIKLDIQQESVLLQRVKRYVQWGGLVCAVAVAMLLTFLKDASIFWRVIAIAVAVLAGIFTALSFFAYRNGRKHVLKNINYLDENK